jgi:hypothetical protein
MYGSMEFDQLFFDLRFKTSWMLQNLIWLKGSNNEFTEIIEDELILHNTTDIITHWEEIEKYIDLVNEADNFYETKEYLKSANKYKEAFEIKEPGSGDRYAAICSFALAEDIESAFYHLFILVNGTSDYSYDDWPLRDSDLDILHHDKRWDEFTLILESNMKKQKNESEQ